MIKSDRFDQNLQRFTVVGYYSVSLQSFVEQVNAPDLGCALRILRGACPTVEGDAIIVVAAFIGDHDNLLSDGDTLRLEDE